LQGRDGGLKVQEQLEYKACEVIN